MFNNIIETELDYILHEVNKVVPIIEVTPVFKTNPFKENENTTYIYYAGSDYYVNRVIEFGFDLSNASVLPLQVSSTNNIKNEIIFGNNLLVCRCSNVRPSGSDLYIVDYDFKVLPLCVISTKSQILNVQ